MDQAQGSQQTALGVVGMVAVAVAYTSFFLQLQLVSRDTNPLCCSLYMYHFKLEIFRTWLNERAVIFDMIETLH